MSELEQAIEIDLPFRFNEQGDVATTRFRPRQALNRLATLADTSPGERVMRPDYGTIIRAMVFDNYSEQLASEAEDSLRTQVRMYDTDIEIVAVSTVNERRETGAGVAIEVSYSVPDYEGGRTTHRALIEVGGEITEETYGG